MVVSTGTTTSRQWTTLRDIMVYSPHLALVSDDQHLAGSIQAHFKKTLGQMAFASPFHSIRNHLGPETGGLLVFAAGRAPDSKEVVRLVQEIRLQQWPATILIVAGPAASRDKELARLDPYVAGRFSWPDQALTLADRIKQRLGRGRCFLGTKDEPLQERIAQQLLGQTPTLRMLAEPLALAATHDVTVLLTGGTGTGKTYLARLIHECSPRKNRRLLVVPCGALVANLIESELFGHVQGAFTGADRAKVGKLEAVGDGTLLLDEIDTLGLEQQANLLRVLETGEYEPVGSNQTKTCTARIIAASNLDLEEGVQQGKFRRDLYYRLNVMAFYLPPLRERVQDIVPLARGMAARFNEKFNKDLFTITPKALSALEAFPWPGNIRQLENVIQQAVLVSSGPELLLEHLPKAVQDASPWSKSDAPARGDSLRENCRVLERSVIERALTSNGYNRAHAALALGISRVTLYKKMKKYGLMGSPAAAGEAV